MRIVDTFMFSEPYEKEVLFIKLNLAAGHVTEWVLVENEYTFQGEHKGLAAREMIEGDVRFAPFRDRLTVISGTERFPPLDPTRDLDEQGLLAEGRQRDLARRYLLDTYDDDTWVLFSDLDEALDLTGGNDEYLARKVAKLGTSVLPLQRIRYWYDIDNRWLDRRATALVLLGEIRRSDVPLLHYRRTWTHTPVLWRRKLVYEYSYCFPRRFIERKFQSHAHPVYSEQEIAQSIDCNHVPVSALRGRQPDPRSFTFWFKKVRLTSRTAPAYVLENQDLLRTNVVPGDYQDRRRRAYPHLFTLSARSKRRLRALQDSVLSTTRGLLELGS
jgi:hypothetical protein